jgi:hydroxyethylthiazole kinase
MRTSEPFIQSTIDALERVRQTSPLVQCITNAVVVNFTANALLALGAAPAMVDIAGEAEPFATIASGLLINLGTPTPEQRAAMIEAQAGAATGNTPWVLDPVAIGSLPVRTPLAYRLRDLRPTVIRGNASEIIALSGVGEGGRGVDALDSVEAALPAAHSLAESTTGVVAVSGPVDLLTDGNRVVRIANGDVLLTRITGGGCALGAVMAAFLAAHDDRLAATVAAVTVYTVAAELAAERSAGPGSFGVAFLDALAGVDAEHIAARARIS